MEKVDISDLLQGDLEDASHLELIHERKTNFRWLVVVELILFILCLPCFIPILAILFVLAAFTGIPEGLEIDESIKHRFFYFKHLLTLRVLNKDGELIDQATWVPGARAEADNFFSDLLASLNDTQLVLVESLGGSLREHLCNWYGGKPLLAMVDDYAEKDSIHALEQQGFDITTDNISVQMRHTENTFGKAIAIALLNGFDITTDNSSVQTTRTETALGKAIAIALLVALGVVTCLFPFILLALFNGEIRRFLKETFLSAIGVPPPEWELVIKAEQVKLMRRRGENQTVYLDIHGRDVIGMSFAANYGFDRDVTYRNKVLRVVCTSRTLEFPTWANTVGEHILKLLVASTLRLRSEQPELGLAFDKERPSKCPYCTAIYIFKPGMNCPSCGGWPDKCS